MKHLLLLISLFTGLVCFSQQQVPDSLNTAKKRSDLLTKRMITELKLTEKQIPKVDSLNFVYANRVEVDVIKSDKSNWSKYWKIQSIMNEKESFLRRIITASQLKIYKKMRSKAMNTIIRNAF
jgi:hypothetical protein